MDNRHGLSEMFVRHPHPEGIIVSEERQFVYMKPTKTAGTSVLRHLLEPRVPGLVHAKDHPGQFDAWRRALTDERLSRYFIFAVVRNPWDRLVSAAEQFDISIKDLVSDFETYCEDEMIRIHTLPQVHYTHLHDRPFVDVICRFEALETDLATVFDRLGLDLPALPHANRTVRGHYSRYYDAATREQVAKIYARDIACYGYRFQVGGSRYSGPLRWLRGFVRHKRAQYRLRM